MKAIRHQIALLIAVFALGLSAYAEESASTIMQRCADKFKATPALTARFAIANTAKPVSGTFTMSRSRFRLSTPPMSIWYDGKTQWTYIADNKEVNISEPTREELMESNPFEVITQAQECGGHQRHRADTEIARPGHCNSQNHNQQGNRLANSNQRHFRRRQLHICSHR